MTHRHARHLLSVANARGHGDWTTSGCPPSTGMAALYRRCCHALSSPPSDAPAGLCACTQQGLNILAGWALLHPLYSSLLYPTARGGSLRAA